MSPTCSFAAVVFTSIWVSVRYGMMLSSSQSAMIVLTVKPDCFYSVHTFLIAPLTSFAVLFGRYSTVMNLMCWLIVIRNDSLLTKNTSAHSEICLCLSVMLGGIAMYSKFTLSGAFRVVLLV